MHDHDDPRRCTICKQMTKAVESYADALNVQPDSIEATVMQYLDQLDLAPAGVMA